MTHFSHTIGGQVSDYGKGTLDNDSDSLQSLAALETKKCARPLVFDDNPSGTSLGGPCTLKRVMDPTNEDHEGPKRAEECTRGCTGSSDGVYLGFGAAEPPLLSAPVIAKRLKYPTSSGVPAINRLGPSDISGPHTNRFAPRPDSLPLPPATLLGSRPSGSETITRVPLLEGYVSTGPQDLFRPTPGGRGHQFGAIRPTLIILDSILPGFHPASWPRSVREAVLLHHI
ncbi:hypothetical protein J6590_071976 [Homalodisca vitripennis]|nr:hypothetical protein J6590_071976 [Homalodisca vitripennis]